jgi:hypothetical protein
MPYPEWNEKTVDRFEKEGRGKGEGEAYLPWYTIRDVASDGYSREVKGIKVRRIHQLLSKTEHRFLLFAEWAKQVIDIREQFPLPLDITQIIAKRLKVQHPCYGGTSVPAVMTVDFLLTLAGDDGPTYMAVDAKDETGAEDRAAINRLEITRTFFDGMDTPHKLVFPSSFDETAYINLKTLRSTLVREKEDPEDLRLISEMRAPLEAWMKSLRGERRSTPTDLVCGEFDTEYGLEPGMGVRVLGTLLYDRVLPVNLHAKEFLAAPVSVLLADDREFNRASSRRVA